MHELLKTGQTVTDSVGGAWVVRECLGAGGQGEVYRVSRGHEECALKWYYRHQSTPERLAALESLVRKGPPDRRFLWPLALVGSPGPQGFGYLMPVREARFRGILDLMTGRIDPSFRTLATAGLNLADSYLQLHAAGLCYRDISFGNAFLDPANGDVAICDNDNVAADRTPGAEVLGTPDFMAPEIVRGGAVPSSDTDRYSLGVLLFYLFHVHHPLIGRRVLDIRCLDLPARRRLCGDSPLFIFDPTDRDNEAIDESSREAGANALLYWRIYPAFLKEVFTRAFTVGLGKPSARVRETEWKAALARLRDSVFYCSCGAENFYDESVVKAGGDAGRCWRRACGRPLQLPFRLKLDSRIVLLPHDGQLFPHHLDLSLDFEFAKPSAEVKIHPTQPDVWGLRNLSELSWTAEKPDGSILAVTPGQSVTLSGGLRINFGRVSGEVRI